MTAIPNDRLITPEQMKWLQTIDSPTLANAIEPFEVRDRCDGFLGGEIRCQFPDLGSMCGYALTVTVSNEHGAVKTKDGFWRMFEAIDQMPKPVVIVMKDISGAPHRVAYAGEVMATLAKKLGVDLARVKATGPEGTVSLQDVKRAAKDGSAAITAAEQAPVEDNTPLGARSLEEVDLEAEVEASPVVEATVPSPLTGRAEPLRGVRRNMARTMAEAHAQVVPTTLFDDADIHAWQPGQDITIRLLRAIVHASRQVPALNAHFDAQSQERRLFDRVDVGLAVDTEDGLFVPAVRDCQVADAATLRARIERIREQVRLRQIPPEQLRDYTIMLSNFGMYAGRYATPVLVPPCVAILAAGKLRHQATPVMGGIESHRVIPLSLCFDHRACTGGEAARFLAALLHDLALAR